MALNLSPTCESQDQHNHQEDNHNKPDQPVANPGKPKHLVAFSWENADEWRLPRTATR
jgi:hypothetical protein